METLDEVIPYVPDTMLPKAIIVDVDGTVALRNGRELYDWSRVGEDLPNQPVIDVIRSLWSYGVLRGDPVQVIFMSGRPEECRTQTELWLDANVGLPFQLHMRSDGDFRQDWIIKDELFSLVRDKYCFLSAWDDRDQMAQYWRKLGLQCFQVAEGKFLGGSYESQGKRWPGYRRECRQQPQLRTAQARHLLAVLHLAGPGTAG